MHNLQCRGALIGSSADGIAIVPKLMTFSPSGILTPFSNSNLVGDCLIKDSLQGDTRRMSLVTDVTRLGSYSTIAPDVTSADDNSGLGNCRRPSRSSCTEEREGPSMPKTRRTGLEPVVTEISQSSSRSPENVESLPSNVLTNVCRK